MRQRVAFGTTPAGAPSQKYIADGAQPARFLERHVVFFGCPALAGTAVGAAQGPRPRRGPFLSHRGGRTAPKLTMSVHSGPKWGIGRLSGFYLLAM